MIVWRVVAAGLAVALLGASPPPAATPAPDDAAARPAATATVSPEIAARARVELDAARSGSVDRTHYAPEITAHLTDASVSEVSSVLKPLGAVKSFTQVRKISQGSLILYVFKVEFEKPPIIEEAIAWNAAGKVEFLQFRESARAEE